MAPTTPAGLTTRQAEVLRLTRDEGLKPKDIAGRLGITPNGVQSHVRKLRKFGHLPEADPSGMAAKPRKAAPRGSKKSTEGRGRGRKAPAVTPEPVAEEILSGTHLLAQAKEGREAYRNALEDRLHKTVDLLERNGAERDRLETVRLEVEADLEGLRAAQAARDEQAKAAAAGRVPDAAQAA